MLAAPLAETARAQTEPVAPPVFNAADRTVGNWRSEAARHLALSNEDAAALLAGSEPKSVSRCVKLNNFWCVKGAGWNGMIAADAEGHAAFASAVEGAAVAALLLRRYYLEFSRRTATAIVSRWAPPQCGGPILARGGRLGLSHQRANLGPDPHLARRGLGNTLRARFLAARRSGRRVYVRSRVPDAPVSLIRAPTIAAGSGEAKISLPALTIAALARPLATTAGAASFTPFACALDGTRLKNYALKAIDGVATSPDDDLKLFEADGEPTPALARVMENMSGVEIGPMRADPEVVKAGIETATAAMRAARDAAGLKPPLVEDAPAPNPDAPGPISAPESAR